MLEYQLSVWRKYPPFVRNQLEIIVVDDGSQNSLASNILSGVGGMEFNLKVFRFQKDIPWNHGSARNLAVAHCAEDREWIILTDIDHVIPQQSMHRLITMKLDPSKTYCPQRMKAVGTSNIQHIRHTDTFIIHREVFNAIGGFDERFAGYWNGVSYPFRKVVREMTKVVDLQDVYFIFHEQDNISDANTQLGREDSEYDIKHAPRKLYKQFRQNIQDYKPERIEQQWTQQL